MDIIKFVYFIYVAIVFFVFTIIFFPIVFIIGLFNNKKSRKILFYVIRIWLRLWLTCIGMPVTKIGNSPTEKCVMISNHISYMDTLVLFPSTTEYFRILGNKEMSRIPLLSVPYKQIGILVDRSSRDSRTKSYKLMMSILRRGTSIFIFPEGKFNTTGNTLKEFYDGAFRLAISTKTPIYPVILPDTKNRWHYSRIWRFSPGKNRVIFLEPVSIEGYTMDNLNELKSKVYDIMDKELKKYK
jgi:1-acyl-sn-glycerol-3-phosphate acyltransferase